MFVWLQLFPNVNKLTVFVRHRSDRLLGSILKRIKHIKSLDLIIQIDDLEYKTEILSYISVLSRLENLRIWNKGVYKEAGISFKTDLVEKLLRRCRKLRIVVLGEHLFLIYFIMKMNVSLIINLFYH